MAEMREAGVTIAIDRIGIDALPLLNVERLDAHWLKLVFDKARLPLLLRADHVEVLRRCRPERLILDPVPTTSWPSTSARSSASPTTRAG